MREIFAFAFPDNNLLSHASSDEFPVERERLSTAVTEPALPLVPFLGELIENIRFSHRFVKTFSLLSLVVLSALTVAHRLRLHHRRRRLKTNRMLLETVTYPPESGARPTITPDLLPLLRKAPWPVLKSRSIGYERYRKIFLYIHGVLAYQPPSIWGYESPTVSTGFVTATYYGINIFYAFYHVPLHRLKLLVLADRLGSLFVINLPLLYLLAAKSPVLKFLTGWSYERVNVLHRAAGRVCITAAVFHFFGFLWVWKATLEPFMTLGEFLSHGMVIFGILAWSCFMVLGGTSKQEFRNAFYEVFLFLHVVLQILGLGFLFFHHSASRPYVLASLGIFLADRLLYRLLYASVRMSGDLHLLPDGGTIRLSLTPPQGYTWTSGDHVFLSIPQIAVLHPHPFSIASPPPPFSHSLEFLVRARDGFSKQLVAAARRQRDVDAVVDGPYGCDAAFQCLQDSTTAVAVAGGSGIAVVYPLVHRLAVEGCGDDGVERQLLIPKEKRRIVLVWVIRDEDSARHWIAEERLQALRCADVEVHIYATASLGSRPILSKELRPLASDHMGVVVSGPDGMVRDVRNFCAAQMRAGLNVDIVAEKFGW